MATSTGHFLEGKTIIVAGSGIAGLAFVLALQKQWDPSLQPPEILIYDRDNRQVNIEREGYSLSLNGMDENGGMIACQDLGLLNEMLKHSVAGLDSVSSFRMWDSNWAELLNIKSKPYRGMPSSTIRIPRRDLRDVLIAAGETTNSITWGTACTSAERLNNGRIRVHLSTMDSMKPDKEGAAVANAWTQECDLLIAADGAHSKIRASLRPNDGLQYAGAVQIGGVARFPEGIPDMFIKNWGLALTGKGVSCFLSPVDSTGVVWALSRSEPDLRPKYDRSSTEQFRAMRSEALELGQPYAEPFASIVKSTEQAASFVIPARDKTPFAHRDENLRGVIFIGDSNHAVSPFAGNGANLALKDGWDLATQLCAAKSLDAAVVAYDKLAVPRAIATIKTSHSRMNWGHLTGLKYYIFRAVLWFGNLMMKLTKK